MSDLIPLLVLGPIAAGVLVPVFGRIHRVVREVWTIAAAAGTAALAVFVLVGQAGGATGWAWSLPGIAARELPLLVVDRVGIFLAVLFSFVFLLTAVYSVGYLRAYPHQSEYYALLLVMLGAVLGLCFSAHLLVLYAFWEIAALATWRLVGFYRRPTEVRIAEKTFLLTFFGSVLMLGGFAVLYVQYRTFNVFALIGRPVTDAPALLMLAGIIAKSASLPLHTWLADAHPAAPSPMSALLSGIIAKVGLIAYLRIFIQSLVPPPYWLALVAALAVASAVVAAGCALVERDYKRILAYSTVSQLGYIFAGFALASLWGVVGGLLYLAAHCLAKAGLFLAFGIVERVAGERDIERLGGLGATLPVTGVAAFVLALSVIGLPPALGFVSKLVVVVSAAGQSLLVAVGLVVTAILTLLYLVRTYSRVFLGAARAARTGREPVLLTAVVVVFAAATVACGLTAGWLARYLEGYRTLWSTF